MRNLILIALVFATGCTSVFPNRDPHALDESARYWQNYLRKPAEQSKPQTCYRKDIYDIYGRYLRTDTVCE